MKLTIQNDYTYSQVPNPKWLIVFVHWLTSSQDEEIFVKWEKIFNENGFSTLRFNLYWEWPKERKLNGVSLQDNIDDVNLVLDYCGWLWYKSIFLVWHSYGWIANLYANYSNVTWLLMWDSSIWWKWLLEDVYEDWVWWHYINWWDWHKYPISEQLYEDFHIPSEKFLEKISEVNVPIKIIWAENWLADAAKKYYEYAQEPKDLTIISWAYHRFDDWSMNSLMEESLKWMNKIIK